MTFKGSSNIRAAQLSDSDIFPKHSLSNHDLRGAALVDLEKKGRGSGFISHPAVVDNCMQMGPAIGALAAKQMLAQEKAVTRVVAGLEGFHGIKFPDRGFAFSASEMMPQGANGDIYTSHWLMGISGEKSLTIKDLKVWISQFSIDLKFEIQW